MSKVRGSIIWGALLVLLGVVLLLESLGIVRMLGRLAWSVVLGGIGLPFLLIYAGDRRQWWSLIPGCVMVSVGLGVLAGGALTPIIIVGGIGVPFWLIYLQDRRNHWALIPAWVMTCVAGTVVLGQLGLEWLIAPTVMFSIAIPFLAVYLADRSQWWALIPGGIMGAIGTFLLLGSIVTASTTAWAVILIILGVWMLIRAFRPHRGTTGGVLPPEPVADIGDVSIDAPAPSATPQQPR